jgi:hypothetical protein
MTVVTVTIGTLPVVEEFLGTTLDERWLGP